MDDDIFATTFAVAASAAIFGFILFSFILAVPITLIATGGWIFYKLKVDSPAAKEEKAREHTNLLYNQVKGTIKNVPSESDFGKEVDKRIPVNLP